MNEAEVQGRVDAIIEQLNFAQNQARMLQGRLALMEAENRALQQQLAKSANVPEPG